MTGRAIPHDIDAEESLLGSMMLSRDAVRAATAVGVTAADFYKPTHGLIFTAILGASEIAIAADPVTVAAQLNGTHDDVGGISELRRIQVATPASANAVAYAAIVRKAAKRRELIAIASTLENAAYDGDDTTKIAAQVALATAPVDSRARLVSGGTFTLDQPDTVPAVWGADDRVLWAEGEGLILAGPAGVGKTTIAVQLVAARIGLIDTLLDLPVTRGNRLLYMACDRPAQIGRAFHRLFGDADRDYLDEHLVIWKGPPPRDIGKYPDTLPALAHDHGADCIFIDSLKDIATKLSDDEVGGSVNIAMQHCLADGIEICALHHQRKGQGGQKPKTLEDLYGSTWLAAGAGSVVLLWGSAGDPIVELSHLKQPAAEIGPIQIDHDHNHGTTTVFKGDVDPLKVLRRSKDGLTANDLAIIATGTTKPTDVQRRKAKRTLDRLVDRNLAHRIEGATGGPEGTVPDRYVAAAHEEPPPLPLDLEEKF